MCLFLQFKLLHTTSLLLEYVYDILGSEKVEHD